MIEFLAGLYVGIGLCVGTFYYVDDDPFLNEQSRVARAIQAFIVAVAWLPLFVSAIGPLIAKDVFNHVFGGESDEQ